MSSSRFLVNFDKGELRKIKPTDVSMDAFMIYSMSSKLAKIHSKYYHFIIRLNKAHQ